MDTNSGKMLGRQQAISKGILNTVDGTYLDLRSGTKMLMGDAVDKELVEVEFDMNAEGK